ncbi:hypothetical protein COO59_11810 [Mixta theicola]|uniref:Hcp1 family type VI secretion system effector n=1 Tax=Mixta theicola TaxID=1458355 RepID=A0A2K1Q8E6_9GAMM|nr:hypothetical protein COO59_11810 [Mixta theicola]GLR10537.1 hypothetical protein GCM10007905_32570 [Mixta theicola]
MSIDLFLKIDGIEGEAKDANHKGWITLSSFSWGTSQPGKMQTGGGLQANRRFSLFYAGIHPRRQHDS